jgi:predicted CopG family antitoxin
MRTVHLEISDDSYNKLKKQKHDGRYKNYSLLVEQLLKIQEENAKLKAELALKDKMLEFAAHVANTYSGIDTSYDHCPFDVIDDFNCNKVPTEKEQQDGISCGGNTYNCWVRYWEQQVKEMM